jgi:predicted permease
VRRFGGDPALVGRSIVLGGRSVTVVGVMPDGFAYPARRFELWLPLQGALGSRPSVTENRALRIFTLVVRLAPGVEASEVVERARVLATTLERAYPDTNDGVSLSMVPLAERIVGDARLPLLVLLCGVGLLLLIACANIATLVLARASERSGEAAVRAALGASRSRLVRQSLTESLVLALLGGIAGCLLAGLGAGAVTRLLEDFVPRTDALGTDGWLLATAAGLTLLTGLSAGLVPALLGSRVGTQPLIEAGRGQIGGRRGRRAGAIFTAVQVALSLVLLVSAMLLARSLVRLTSSPAGYIADRLLTTHVKLEGRDTDEQRAETVERLMRQIAGVPGVTHVGGATGQPPVTAQRGTRFAVDGVSGLGDQAFAYFVPATPDYFHALGARLRAGRAFTADDRAGAPPVVLVSETLARRIAPGGSAIGRRLRLINPEQGDAWRTVVGVVPDIRYNGIDDANALTIYTPFAQTPFGWVYVFVRGERDSAELRRAIAAAVAEVDPVLRPPQVQAVAALVRDAASPWIVNTVVVGSFAGGAVARCCSRPSA